MGWGAKAMGADTDVLRMCTGELYTCEILFKGKKVKE